MGMTTYGLSYWQAETEGINSFEMTIGDLLDRRADELSIRWTYQDYRDRAKAVAKGLLAMGLARSDHIAVWAADILEWLLLEMAAKAGLVLVTINPLLQALFFMARVRTYDHLAILLTLISPVARQGEVTSERLPRLRFLCLMGSRPALSADAVNQLRHELESEEDRLDQSRGAYEALRHIPQPPSGYADMG